MHLNITDTEKGNNKGSSGKLVHYLDKENRVFSDLDEQLWFNGNFDDIESYEVRSKLDANIAKLCRDDSKFFLVNISPSQKEIAFLVENYGEQEAKEQLKDFAVAIMDRYAQNFNRDNIASNEDLLWFGKLEHHRHYSFRDIEVKKEQVKTGSVKPGDQWHLQLIVSRKDITNSIKLSPMNKSRGRNVEHSKKLGQFDRTAFKQCGEDLFDKMFGFDRGLKETFRYANIQKNGSLEEKMHLQKELRDSGNTEREFPSEKLLKLDNLLEILLKTEYSPNDGMVARKKPKKKKGEQQDQSNGMGM